MPPMGDCISPEIWAETPPLGGTCNWQGPEIYSNPEFQFLKGLLHERNSEGLTICWMTVA